MPKISLIDNKYYFDAEDGTEAVECKTWIEKSKKNANHPDGKPWIILPKGNIANRQYYSIELFNSTAVDGVVDVKVKTSAPRVIGSSGVKSNIVKYLDEATGAEYTNLVNNAVEAYKTAKANCKRKKPEEMTVEELEAYVAALKEGKKLATVSGPSSFMDMFSDAEYQRYNEIIALAQTNKANAPRASHGPLTEEQKKIRKEKRIVSQITKAEALLAALKAQQNV